MTKENKNYTASITNSDKSKVEIKGEISWEYLKTFESKVFAKMSEKLELDGFRKGSVPESVARKHLPDELVLTDMAEAAISEIYPSIIKDNQLDAIGRPELAITKIARDNPLGFTISVFIVPEIKLPDYKKIAKTIAMTPPNDVTDEGVDKVIQEVRQMRAYGHVHGADDKHDHTEELPEVNDEFAKSFGNFTNLDDMKAKVKENLITESEAASKDKRRVGIMEAIIKDISIEIPEIILQSETDKMISQLEADVSRSGATLDQYLEHIKKTKEELIKEFAPEAEKRAKFQLLLNAISRAESIAPTEEEINAEVEKLMNMYPGADKGRTEAYADMMLTNGKVLEMLESQ